MLQSVRHWFETTANLWLIAFAVYYAFGLILGFISALIDRRFGRGSERRVGIIELGVFLPIVLPALAVGWVLEKVLLVLVGYPIWGLIWLWHKIFNSERRPP
jgi:ABC-type spermidine/putrescine transport system permease subunit II